VTQPLAVSNEQGAARQRFIIDNTKLLSPPLVPEIVLHLAEESLPIWQKTEEEIGALNVPPPYWAFAWAGGQAIARYFLDNRDICSGKRVLDLGSGSGLAGIAAMKAGARYCLAVDIDVYAIAAIEENASANGVAIDTTCRDLLDERGVRFDVAIIGDLFYERELAERVTAFIDNAKSAGAEVYIGDPERSYFPRGRFGRVAEYKVPVSRELEDAEIKKTSVWRA
jgi:predicted nicotinamide N-methyase